MSQRGICLNDRKQVQQYIETFYNHCTEDNIFKQMEIFNNNSIFYPKHIENIDIIYSQAYFTAKKASCQRPQLW